MNELEVLKNSLNVSVWMLSVTVFLSVSTVTIGAINMAFQRSHNRKSVKPFCNIHKLKDGKGIRIGIMNAGLGPMIIMKILLIKEYDDPVKNGLLLNDVLPEGLLYDTAVNNKDTYILPSMGELNLFSFTEERRIKNISTDEVISKLEDYYICVIFKDIYDHSYEKREPLKF